MGDDQAGLQSRLLGIGLTDPFVRGIVGLVAIATVVNIVMSLLGDGMRAVLAIGISIVFGVVLIIVRVLIRYADGLFVKVLCYIIAGSIASVFVMFIVFAVPAVVICWPEPYHDTLGLKACSTSPRPAPETRGPFTPVAFTGPGVVSDPTNARFTLWVFYRPDRQQDAERVVGAFLSAGYVSRGMESTLNEVSTDDHAPNATLIKTSTTAQALAPEVLRIVKLAIPVVVGRVRLDPQPIALSRGDVQVDLF